MKSSASPVLRDIVLIGGGHSHVGVLRMFGMRPEPGVRLTVICTTTDTPYSGMLPGYVAGHYSFDDVHIDLSRLAVFAQARFVRDRVVGIDRAQQKVICANRPPIAYDLCSINIGSTPQVARVPGALDHTVPVKPIQQFNERWLSVLDRVRQHPGRTTIAIVGGGAGGVELTLAMQYRLRNELRTLGRNPDDLVFHLFTRDGVVMPTHNRGVQQRFARVLHERGVHLHLNAEIARVEAGGLLTTQGQRHEADEIIWVTQAGGPDWLRDTGLPVDDNGFLHVNACLQSPADERIFAAGDIAAFGPRPLEKAGVFAVRMGPVLADNLRRSARGQTLREYKPQRHWLSLVTTGDPYAVASRGPFGLAGRWVWRWKDRIDRGFMAKFRDFPPMPQKLERPSPSVALSEDENRQAISAIAMRCGGCGAKVGATVLSRALGSLQPLDKPDVLIGLHAPDDAAVVRVPPGMAMVHTVDFFRAFVDDPYIFGRIAANHALGDIFAMGAQAQSATAIATVPPGLEAKVEELLRQMMGGAIEVLNEAGCALVGGHTGEGTELALGFAINGLIDEQLQGVMTKGRMKPGEVLLLTKPIGTGTLFAAHARMAARGRWIDAALQNMQVSNREAARILREHGSSACTDLTGFGLLGHLVEMTRPSGVDVRLNLAPLPVLAGAEETAAAGILSSLQPANVRLRRALRNQAEFVNHPRYPLLFDPQTAGGLLASLPRDRAHDCLTRLHEAGYLQACVIGDVAEQGDALEPIVLCP